MTLHLPANVVLMTKFFAILVCGIYFSHYLFHRFLWQKQFDVNNKYIAAPTLNKGRYLVVENTLLDMNEDEWMVFSKEKEMLYEKRRKRIHSYCSKQPKNFSRKTGNYLWVKSLSMIFTCISHVL